MSRVRVQIEARDRSHLADLRGVHRTGVVRQTARAGSDGRWRVQAVASEDQLHALRAAGYEVTELDRGAVRTPDQYLSVDQVEARIAKLAQHEPATCSLIALPHKTWEERTVHALRIGAGDAGTGAAAGRPGIYLLGGVHAREWGSPDILVNLAEKLVSAYRQGHDLKIGKYALAARDVAGLVEGSYLYVLPQANPDGRHHSLTIESMWRKNRRPAPPGRDSSDCKGVDLNRNFDFLWDFERHFSPTADAPASADACDYETYHGPQAASEPEVRNVVWLLDEHPDIGYFVDVHSYGELILYSWGDDEDQQTDPDMNFGNPAWDGKRGAPKDQYGEYLDSGDRARCIALANGMRDAIGVAGGRTYTVEQAMSLYPTAGTSDDYAYSRHLADASRTKTLSFTVEWGAETNPTPFHPPYAVMAGIIDEVTCGLLEFARVAVAGHD
jgi:carboxypeptidase T